MLEDVGHLIITRIRHACVQEGLDFEALGVMEGRRHSFEQGVWIARNSDYMIRGLK